MRVSASEDMKNQREIPLAVLLLADILQANSWVADIHIWNIYHGLSILSNLFKVEYMWNVMHYKRVTYNLTTLVVFLVILTP